MGRTAAQGPGARVEHSVHRGAPILLAVFRVLLLHLVRGIMPDKKVPPHRVVLAGEAMERRHVVIVGQTVDAGLVVIGARQLPRIAARLQQKHRAPGLGEPRGERPASGAGADNDVIERAPLTHRYPLSWYTSSALSPACGARVRGPSRSGGRVRWALLTVHGARPLTPARSAPGSGEGDQNVFRKAISAFLSASLRLEPK